MINISTNEMKIIKDILKDLANECTVLAFGSRVRGDYNKYSDLDLSFKAENKLGFQRIEKLKESFQDSDLLFRVDIVDYNAVSHNFRKIIDESNEQIYP